MSYKITILTLFPDMFPGPLGMSITGRGLKEGHWELEVMDVRDFATDKHRTVDDTPYGGGAGMVMKADVVAKAIDAARKNNPGAPVAFLTPAGAPFAQKHARGFASEQGLILLCGHYEGIDERVIESHVDVEISLGDFVLTGGEIAAFSVADAVARLLPGVLGNADTLHEESFDDGLLEYPHYTRPEVWNGKEVPAVLKSGHHGEIARWRREMAEKRTQLRRPDLWAAYTDGKKNPTKG